DIIGSQPDPCSALFSEIPGYPKNFAVLVNPQNSQRISALACGMSEEDSLLPPLEYVRNLKSRMKKIHDQPRIPPVTVKEAPFFENVDEAGNIDLYKFPAPRWNQGDGNEDQNRYIGTGCVCITADPDSGTVNLGIYRIVIHDEKTLGLYMSPNKDGMANMKKYNAGGIRQKPIEVVIGAHTGLPIPASAEIVIEGFVHPNDLRDEGPFGEWVGYYSTGTKPESVIHVKSVMFRNDPIIFGHPHLKAEAVGMPWRWAAAVWNRLDACGVPDVKGVWAYGQLWTVVSICQRYPGHARQAGIVASQTKPGSIGARFTIVVDDDIDPSDSQAVLWAMGTRMNPIEDIEIIRRSWSSSIDPMIPPNTPAAACFTSKAVFDACKPYEWRQQFPSATGPSLELRASVYEKWKSLL